MYNITQLLFLVIYVLYRSGNSLALHYWERLLSKYLKIIF